MTNFESSQYLILIFTLLLLRLSLVSFISLLCQGKSKTIVTFLLYKQKKNNPKTILQIYVTFSSILFHMEKKDYCFKSPFGEMHNHQLDKNTRTVQHK